MFKNNPLFVAYSLLLMTKLWRQLKPIR